ncbi:hypothetical protein POSPLADRAFT_1184233, partial [Postia placenta MAD-698-R-SB12]
STFKSEFELLGRWSLPTVPCRCSLRLLYRRYWLIVHPRLVAEALRYLFRFALCRAVVIYRSIHSKEARGIVLDVYTYRRHI